MMSSIIEGYNFDIFISYRQKDNKYDGWVTEFVDNLKKELEATFKEEINVYFDINPYDGLLETHDVDASLEEKLKCLIFIPIVSRTYCDPKSFAWEHEFKAFIEKASKDQFGMKVKLPNGNVANRVLPVRIHDLDIPDVRLCETVLGGALRGLEFIYKESGVNRSLTPKDNEEKNFNKTNYRNQINKVALAIKEIIQGMKAEPLSVVMEKDQVIEPYKEAREEERNVLKEKPPKLPRKNLLIGLIVIGVLLLIVSIFVYPKISGSRSSLNAMTVPVTVINENGERDVRRILKDSYITRLAIYPFNNEANDSSKNWLQYGLFHAIYYDLRQFNYAVIGTNSNVNHLQEQIKDAKTNNFPYFLTGNFRITDGIYEITSKLYQTTNGTVVAERIFKGNDFFSIIDSISLQTRIDLGVSKIVLSSYPDLPFSEHSTNNLNAFRYIIRGLYIDSLYTNLHRSIELDSTFAFALYARAGLNYAFQESFESALKDINQAMRHRQRLSEFYNISTRILYYLIRGENNKAITLSEMQYELNPKDALLLSDLIDTYERNFMIDKNEKAAQQLTELIPNDPYYLNILARSYLFTGELNKALKILEKLPESSSEDVDALLLMGEIYLHKNNLEAAEKVYQKALLIQPENEKNWSRMFDYIDYSRKHPIKSEFFEPLTGNYRFETSEMTITFFIHNNHLIGKAKNQAAMFQYPVSDKQFISVNGIYSFTFFRNTKDEVIKIIFCDPYDQSYILWKQDTLIYEAMNLLNEENKSKALYAFREAYARNPDHYYLANFIQHLELIQSEEYERIKAVLDTYIGKYGDMAIFKKNNNFYYEDYNGYLYKLLPLSQDKFVMPSFYDRQIQIIRKNNSIEGLKVIYWDGEEKFFARNN